MQMRKQESFSHFFFKAKEEVVFIGGENQHEDRWSRLAGSANPGCWGFDDLKTENKNENETLNGQAG